MLSPRRLRHRFLPCRERSDPRFIVGNKRRTGGEGDDGIKKKKKKKERSAVKAELPELLVLIQWEVSEKLLSPGTPKYTQVSNASFLERGMLILTVALIFEEYA